MAMYSSTLAWKIPWTQEPGRLQFMGLHRVGHNWATSRGLWLLKITYLDASFNVGNWVVADDSCKSTEYSSSEVNSKHKNGKQKLLSMWSIHWNIPFRSYDRKKKSDLFVYHPVLIFWVNYQLYLFAAGNAYINICLIRVPLRLFGIILHLQRKAFKY